MAKFFIHRPVFAIVISIIISIIGVIAGMNTPIAQYPNISPPTINVSAFYTGANASVVNPSRRLLKTKSTARKAWTT